MHIDAARWDANLIYVYGRANGWMDIDQNFEFSSSLT